MLSKAVTEDKHVKSAAGGWHSQAETGRIKTASFIFTCHCDTVDGQAAMCHVIYSEYYRFTRTVW